MIIKFFLGIAIVGFTTYCGYLLSKKYRRKKYFYQQFFAFNERFLNEIVYYRRPLAEWINGYDYDGEFAFLLEDFFKNIQQDTTLSLHEIYTSAFSFLSKDDKREIEDYFRMLGKGDSISQKTYFSSVKETLKTKSMHADQNAKKFTDLYIKLGFLCGLFFLILML